MWGSEGVGVTLESCSLLHGMSGSLKFLFRGKETSWGYVWRQNQLKHDVCVCVCVYIYIYIYIYIYLYGGGGGGVFVRVCVCVGGGGGGLLLPPSFP